MRDESEIRMERDKAIKLAKEKNNNEFSILAYTLSWVLGEGEDLYSN